MSIFLLAMISEFLPLEEESEFWGSIFIVFVNRKFHLILFKRNLIQALIIENETVSILKKKDHEVNDLLRWI